MALRFVEPPWTACWPRPGGDLKNLNGRTLLHRTAMLGIEYLPVLKYLMKSLGDMVPNGFFFGTKKNKEPMDNFGQRPIHW